MVSLSSLKYDKTWTYTCTCTPWFEISLDLRDANKLYN